MRFHASRYVSVSYTHLDVYKRQVTVVLINTGMSPAMAMLCALLAGAAAGFITGFLHTIFQIPAILSGILTMIALYSVNIRIMSDKATVALEQPSLKTWMLSLLPEGTVSNTVSVSYTHLSFVSIAL